jgi:hypothetical protein
VLSSHDLEFLARWCDRGVLLTAGSAPLQLEGELWEQVAQRHPHWTRKCCTIVHDDRDGGIPFIIEARMRKLAEIGVVLTTLVVILAACGSSVFKQPQVTLEGVQIGGLGLTGGTLMVHLEIINPNRFALNANQLDYELALRDPREPNDTVWVDFASGIYDVPFTVAAGDTAASRSPSSSPMPGSGARRTRCFGAAPSPIVRPGRWTFARRSAATGCRSIAGEPCR